MKGFRKIRIVLILCTFILPLECISQDSGSLRFLFYNVENLFDTRDDSLTIDEEFTPEGDKHWSIKRYYKKLDGIASVLTAVGGFELPAIVGLCEVENRHVLNDLCEHRLLSEADYHIVHKDSPDRRGIDVALLYRADFFDFLESKWLKIQFDSDSSLYTRDILYVKGKVFQSDTIHIFINHWPSRWGGVESTRFKRIEVAGILRSFIDSLFASNASSNIIIAGDFNDTPQDSSIIKVLNACAQIGQSRDSIYNLMYPIFLSGKSGTLKHQANWEVFDQIIVSGSLLDSKMLFVKDGKAHIYSPDFLLEEDERYLGKKTFRTYSGPKYLGGFSDHLPVYIDLLK